MLRITLAMSGLLVVSFAVGCTPDCNTVEPVYAGDATDEVWLEMLDARADAEEGGDAATFTAPAPDAALSSSSSPTFSWDSPLKVALAPAAKSSSSLPQFSGTWRHRAPSFFDRVVDVVLPSARAHEPPVTSDVYLLEVEVPGRTCPVAGLTSELSFAFDDEGWASIAAGGGARTARLLSAFLTENNVTEGPYLAAPLAFTVTE